MLRIDIKEQNLDYRTRVGLFVLLRNMWGFVSPDREDWSKVAGISRPSIDHRHISWMIQLGPCTKTQARKWDVESQLETFLDKIVPENILKEINVSPIMYLKFKVGDHRKYKVTFRRINNIGLSLKDYITATSSWIHPRLKTKLPMANYFESMRFKIAESLALHHT